MSSQRPRWKPAAQFLCHLALAAILCLATSGSRATEPLEAAGPVATSEHFAFYSDFAMNLDDALIGAADDRLRDRPELFREGGEEAACFADLPPVERAGWDHAVEFYAEAVAPRRQTDPPRDLPRLLLAGITTEAELDEAERQLASVIGHVRQAAAPAYRACRWPAQSMANREWVEQVLPYLETYEADLAPRLAEIFQRPWHGLPLRIDVMEHADPTGAHTINLQPPDGAHVKVSSSHPDWRQAASLELVFHEGGHFLTGRGTPVRQAVRNAMAEHRYRFSGDLVHHVHFWLVGEEVRRALAAGGVDYEPFMYAAGRYRGRSFEPAMTGAFTPYLDGERSLEEAADLLVLSLLEAMRSGGS